MNTSCISLTCLTQCHSNDKIMCLYTKDPLDHSKADSVQLNCQSNALGV